MRAWITSLLLLLMAAGSAFADAGLFLERQSQYARKSSKDADWLVTSPKAKQIRQVIATYRARLFWEDAFTCGDGNCELIGDEIDEAFDHIYRFSDLVYFTWEVSYNCTALNMAEECLGVEALLDQMLTELCPLYIELYRESLARHATREITEELEFIYLLQRDEGLWKNWPKPFAEPPLKGQPAWFKSLYLLEAGFWCVEQTDYEQAVSHFSEVIVLDDVLLYGAARLARAHAYLELGNFDEAIADYDQYVAEGGEVPYPIRIKSIDYGPFAKGFFQGTRNGIKASGEEVSSWVLSSASGIFQGQWCYACDVDEVPFQICDSVHDLISYLNSNGPADVIQDLIPELKDLVEDWDQLNSFEKGLKSGYIFGKYGADCIIPGKALGVLRRLRLFKRVTTLTTVDQCATSSAKLNAIRQRALIHQSNRDRLVSFSRIEEYYLPARPNKMAHVLQKHHQWDSLVELTGDIERDFRTVSKLLRQHNITDQANFKGPINHPDLTNANIQNLEFRKTINGRNVVARFERRPNENELFLNNAWVEK